jgi:hypothetical protein
MAGNPAGIRNLDLQIRWPERYRYTNLLRYFTLVKCNAFIDKPERYCQKDIIFSTSFKKGKLISLCFYGEILDLYLKKSCSAWWCVMQLLPRSREVTIAFRLISECTVPVSMVLMTYLKRLVGLPFVKQNTSVPPVSFSSVYLVVTISTAVSSALCCHIVSMKRINYIYALSFTFITWQHNWKADMLFRCPSMRPTVSGSRYVSGIATTLQAVTIAWKWEEICPEFRK